MLSTRDAIPGVSRRRAALPTGLVRSPVSGITIRAALFAGFGVAFALWFLTGYGLTQRMSDVEAQTAAINTRYMRAQDALATVRAQVLLASVSVRDALLDPDQAMRDTYLNRFEASYRLTMRGIDQYVPIVDSSDERARIAELRREIGDFHRDMLDVYATTIQKWPRDAIGLLQQHVWPKRDVVVRVSDQIQALNRTAFLEQRAETARLNRLTQRWAWERLGFVLAASVGIGLFATFYASRLEKRLRLQQERDRRTAEELQQLSARLVTVQEDERRSIARELHDEVGQSLTAVKMELALATRTLVAHPDLAERLDDARQTIEHSVRAVRDLSHLLHPALLDDLGLVPALRHHLDGYAQRCGLQCDLFEAQTDNRLAPEVSTTVYRIVQEAMNNIAKHAHASKCRVALEGRPSTVLLTIEDDGSGFDPASLDRPGGPRGLGLIGIRERVAQFGGTFNLETAAGQGTRLEIELPARPRPGTSMPEPAADAENVVSAEVANLSW